MYRRYAEITNSRDIIKCEGCDEDIVRERASSYWQRDPKQIRYFYRYADTGETHSDYCVTLKANESLRLDASTYHRMED